MVTKKAILPAILAMGLVFSSSSVSASTQFLDVNSSHWASKTIYEYAEKGYLLDTQTTYFYPNNAITRAEALVLISKVKNVNLDSVVKLNAKDLPHTHKYYKEVRKMVELGVIDNAAYINPNQPLKRSELTKILANGFNIEVDSVNKSKFKDYSRKFWARDYIESMADAGLVNGVGQNLFQPDRFVTNAEMVTLLSRIEAFKRKESNYEIIYDFMKKDYVNTYNAYASWVNEVIYLSNVEREKLGLKPLTHDPTLTQIAIVKAQDMVNQRYFEHKSPIYGDPWNMAMLFDYPFVRFAENLGRYQKSPYEVVSSWMKSKEHRANITNPAYLKVGSGICVTKRGEYYWVQLFSG